MFPDARRENAVEVRGPVSIKAILELAKAMIACVRRVSINGTLDPGVLELLTLPLQAHPPQASARLET